MARKSASPKPKATKGQKTKPQKVEAPKAEKGERKLTPKQIAFARAYVETGNQSEAYRRAYSTKNLKPETIRNNAYMLMQHRDVSAMVASLKVEIDGKVIKDLGLSREWVLERLMRNAEIALGEKTIKVKLYRKTTDEIEEVEISDRDASAANAALTSLGKVDTIGLFIERSKVEISKTLDDLSDDELDAFIANGGKVS